MSIVYCCGKNAKQYLKLAIFLTTYIAKYDSKWWLMPCLDRYSQSYIAMTDLG